MTNEQIIPNKERILGVALWIEGKGTFRAEIPARHDVPVLSALRFYTSEEVAKGIQGFWTNNDGRFVDLKQAAKIAFEAGQIPEQVSILMSEDLW